MNIVMQKTILGHERIKSCLQILYSPTKLPPYDLFAICLIVDQQSSSVLTSTVMGVILTEYLR